MSASVLTPTRYSTAAIFLHWALAALLIFQLALGWRLDGLDTVPRFIAFQLHKSVGIAILLLSLVRIGIRLGVRRPAPVATSRPLGLLAGATHGLLYFVMIAGPLTGWVMVSSAPVRMQTLLFGLVPWPDLPLGGQWNKSADMAHQAVAWLFVGLLLLHVAGALRHHMLRDDLIARMMPRSVISQRGLTLAVLVTLLGSAGAFAAAWFWPFTAPPARVAAQSPLPATDDNAAELALDNAAAAIAVPPVANIASNETQAEEVAKAAAATPWRVQAGGKLGFRAEHSGMPIEGSFKRWDAEIVFDAEDLPNSTISVSIDLASVDSADSDRDSMLASDSFFDVAVHPRARFRSSRISHRGGNAYRAAGTLSFHGQQRPVTLDFTLDIRGDDAVAAGSTTLSRTAFNVGTGQWASTDDIKDGVAVTFSFKAKRAAR